MSQQPMKRYYVRVLDLYGGKPHEIDSVELVLAAEVEATEADRDTAYQQRNAAFDDVAELQHALAAKEAELVDWQVLTSQRDTLQAELATANEITRLHCEQGVRMDKELARLNTIGEAQRLRELKLVEALQGVRRELERYKADYQRIIKEVLACNPLPASSRSDDQLEPPWEVIARMRTELARVREALEDLVGVIQSAGIYQLSTGVELGATVWFVKCSDAIKQAQAALQPSRGEQG